MPDKCEGFCPINEMRSCDSKCVLWDWDYGCGLDLTRHLSDIKEGLAMVVLSLERSRTDTEGYDRAIARSMADGCCDVYEEAGWK